MVSSDQDYKHAVLLYSRPSDAKRMEIFLSYSGHKFDIIHTVARSHGKLLGFENDRNELPSASLAHSSRTNQRFRPQARF